MKLLEGSDVALRGACQQASRWLVRLLAEAAWERFRSGWLEAGHGQILVARPP